MSKKNQKAQSAQVSNNESVNVANNATATTAQVEQPQAQAQATATDEKEAQEKEAQRKKAIAAKVEAIKKTAKEIHEKRDVTDFLDTSDKGIAATTATKFQTLGKFHGKFQAIEAKDGGKTVYIFESEKDIYIGFTSSELSDIFKLEKRSYKKNGESTEESTESETLQALKNFRKSLEKVQQLGFAKTLEISEVETWITTQEQQDAEYTDFITKRGTDIEDSTTYTEESKLLEDFGKKFVEKLKTYKLGFFAPKESNQESNQGESNQESNQQTEESK